MDANRRDVPQTPAEYMQELDLKMQAITALLSSPGWKLLQNWLVLQGETALMVTPASGEKAIETLAYVRAVKQLQHAPDAWLAQMKSEIEAARRNAQVNP